MRNRQGLTHWDYGSQPDLRKANERWFEKAAKDSGADKAGHFRSTYAWQNSTGTGYMSRKKPITSAPADKVHDPRLEKGIENMGETPGHGMSDRETLYRRLLWIAVAGSFLIYFWGIWAVPTLSLNEARRMVVVQEMFSNHDWLFPTLNNELYLVKPPLFYWLALIFCLIFHSTAEWVMRLPSVLGALGITWFVFFHVKKHFGRWPALFTVCILVTSYFFSNYARSAEIEMVLAALTAGSVLLYFDYLKAGRGKTYLYLSYSLLGIGCLTKGPVVLIFFVFPILLFGVLQKDRQALKGLVFFPGWLLFLSISLPWYVYTGVQSGAGAWSNVIKVDIALKVWTSKRDPFYYYFFMLLGAFAPWTLLLFYRTRTQIKILFSRYDYQYFALAFVVPLIIFSFFSYKHGKYILPLFPPGAVLLGIWFSTLFSDLEERRGKRFYTKLAMGVGILVLGYFTFYATLENRFYKYRYEAFGPVVGKLRQYSDAVPVYSFVRLPCRLIYYYEHPIPVVMEDDINRMISQNQAFLLIADGRFWERLKDKRLRMVMQYAPYLKKNRKVGLFIRQRDNAKEKRSDT